MVMSNREKRTEDDQSSQSTAAGKGEETYEYVKLVDKSTDRMTDQRETAQTNSSRWSARARVAMIL